MRRSKLDLCIAVLDVVLTCGPLNITGLLLRGRMNYVQLKPILHNLMNQGAVQEQRSRNGSIIYAVTPLGQQLSAWLKQTDNSKTVLTTEIKQNNFEMIIPLKYL